MSDIDITQAEADTLIEMENALSMKATYQNRARQAIILMRLDLDGSPHRNPDGEEILCPHLHFYREGFGDKWAIAAPLLNFA